jgi:hypothetical protein
MHKSVVVQPIASPLGGVNTAFHPKGMASIPEAVCK